MKYRLIRNVYVDRVQHEDGPGSLMNVVQDVRRGVHREWSLSDETPEKSAIRYAEAHVPVRYSDEDPRIEETYTLERHKDDSCDWEYVTTLHPKVVDDQPYEDEDDREG